MAGEVAGAAAPVSAQQGAAPMTQRAKIGDLRGMVNEAPAAPAIIHQGETAPVGPQTARRAGDTPLAFDDNGNPDLGHPGDLDAEARIRNAQGNELDDYGITEPASIELDDSMQSELVDPSEYEALRSKWDADDLAPEMDNKWVELQVKNTDGSTYPLKVTVAELKEGNLRNQDYSNKLAEVSALRRQCVAIQEGSQRLMNDLSAPQTLIQAMHNLGKFEVFEAACELYATHERLPLEELKRRNPEAYQAEMARRAAVKHAQLIEQQARQALAQAQQQQPTQQQLDQTGQQAAHQLQQMFPIALERAGVAAAKERSPLFKLLWDEPVGNGLTRGEHLFGLHYGNLLPTLQGQLTTQFVCGAMQAARETCEAMVRDQTPRNDPRLPPQNVGAAPGGQPRVNGQAPQRQPKSAKIGDMGKLLREIR